jgi:hypothetical protein
VGGGGGGTREIKKILLARPRQPLPTLFTEFPRIKYAGSPFPRIPALKLPEKPG